MNEEQVETAGPPAERPPREPLPRLGDGVILRRLAVTDLAAFQAYRHDAELGRYQGWSAVSDEEAAAFLAQAGAAPLLQPGEWAQIGIARPGDDTLLGDIGLFLASDGVYAEIGYTLSRAAQGQGLATRAVREAIALVFEHTPAERVIAITDDRNSPSIRLLERAGLHRIATDEALFRGEPCLEHTYAIARPPGG
ncbi:MAG: GNAT family N-acetyltransferase [Candidatus Promineofilum sp.]|nr:GNAT family N-acetyltransferase [Promineifilum sp.]